MFLYLHCWPKVILLTSTHTLCRRYGEQFLWRQQIQNAWQDTCSFICIHIWLWQIWKEISWWFITSFNSNMMKVYIFFFLNTFIIPSLILERAHTNVRKLYHIYLINSLNKRKLGKKPSHIQLAFICKSTMTDTDFLYDIMRKD